MQFLYVRYKTCSQPFSLRSSSQGIDFDKHLKEIEAIGHEVHMVFQWSFFKQKENHKHVAKESELWVWVGDICGHDLHTEYVANYLGGVKKLWVIICIFSCRMLVTCEITRCSYLIVRNSQSKIMVLQAAALYSWWHCINLI